MKFTKQMVNRIWFLAIFACALLAVFSLFFAACAKQSPEDSSSGKNTGSTAVTDNGGKESSTPETDDGNSGVVETNPLSSDTPTEAPVQSTVRLGLTEDAGREYLDKLIFLGDSTTYGIGYYYNRGFTELCPPTQVWTPASGTLALFNYNVATIVYPETGEEITIQDAVTRAQPEYLVITLGVNGIATMGEADFTADYTALVKIVQEASPNTKIILNSIYPVSTKYQYWDQINNTKIQAANEWIEQIAEDTGTRFLYSYECVADDDGNLPDENQNGDNIHLSGEGFTKVMEYIRTHAYL